jgi:hypothetical protein
MAHRLMTQHNDPRLTIPGEKSTIYPDACTETSEGVRTDPMGLLEVRANWPEHPRLSKKKKKTDP